MRNIEDDRERFEIERHLYEEQLLAHDGGPRLGAARLTEHPPKTADESHQTKAGSERGGE